MKIVLAMFQVFSEELDVIAGGSWLVSSRGVDSVSTVLENNSFTFLGHFVLTCQVCKVTCTVAIPLVLSQTLC